MSPSPLLVMKFGGTSVGTAEAMQQAVRIVLDARQAYPQVVAVTSALSGITDLLINSATAAARDDLSVFRAAHDQITDRHHQLARGLVSHPTPLRLLQRELDRLIAEFDNLCSAIHVLGELSPRALDAVASLGERMSARVLATAIESQGIGADSIDATRIMITDDHFTNAAPDMVATTAQTQSVLMPLLKVGRVPVVTGFIGATPTGQVTTLGRGGSDYTASILAVALGATECWIWTDVDGVMTADPRIVPDARTIPVISYREVAEMAHFGAKVLHPKSIHPVIEAGISLRVCNTFNPSSPGTRLVAEPVMDRAGSIRAIAAIRGMQLITLSGRGMLGVPGVAGRIFSSVATTGISVPLIIESTSEQAICFPAPISSVPLVIATLQKHLAEEFRRGDIDRVFASDEVDIITVICPGLRTTTGIAGQIFGTLGAEGINVLGISFGASEVSINLIVSAQDTKSAVRVLHSLVK